ncbi:putative Late nodulin [Medicago truncatula]|uniref:Putative Late nodulin n=1 Tax=Medicago truncatula TaxID=3880 RepID=A0A396IT73_MEDTR|nr:putative Late nodulin [Medicago truncatula]
MHMEENMVEIIKFIYVMVNFISVFLVSMNVEGRKCKQDSDCPEYICTFPWKPTCVEAYFLMYNRQNYCTCT